MVAAALARALWGLTALTIRYLRGNAGHSPAFGFKAGGGPPTGPELVGVFLAALSTLCLGAALGPEAPARTGGRWVQLLGRLTCVEGHRARFADDLAESVAFGDARYADIRRPRPRVVARRYQPLSGP